MDLDPNRWANITLKDITLKEVAEKLSLVTMGKRSAAEMLPFAHAISALPDDDPRRGKLYWLFLDGRGAVKDGDFHTERHRLASLAELFRLKQ